MEINERIKALRINSSMTREDLSDKIGFSITTISNWESGVKAPSMKAIILLAETFCVTTDYMLGVSNNNQVDFSLLNHKEKTLISNYRSLDSYGKSAVESVCAIEKRRVDEAISDELSPSRYIPIYLSPSAAGTSVPLGGDDFEMMLIDGNVPKDADFAVRIQGNSMHPYIDDGDTVYVRKTQELSSGDIGIFSVDGAMYCKQYYLDNDRNLTLISANQQYESTNVFVDAESGSTVKCYGKVLIGTKTPLPEYFQK